MNLIQLNQVSLQLPTLAKPILNSLNYEINVGDFIILVGSNGSGKSTLLKLLRRQFQPTQGEILFLGKDLRKYTNKYLSKEMRLLTQNCNDSLFTSLTVYENYLLTKFRRLTFFIHHKREKEKLAEYLMQYHPQLPHKLDQCVNHLSGGEKQALALALCLIHPPKILLLDEHTSALDPKTSAEIMQITAKAVRELNLTCILTTHDLDEAKFYGNRLLVLRDGKIILNANEALKKTFTKQMLVANYD